ncbi:MAG: hypothetical protein ACXACY_28710 [Candidatus Hodarchaeales archaeon]|jgi:hypothetical protein
MKITWELGKPIKIESKELGNLEGDSLLVMRIAKILGTDSRNTNIKDYRIEKGRVIEFDYFVEREIRELS